MKFRTLCLGLVALVSMTSGCLYHNHPCFGFRLHPCASRGEGGCSPCSACKHFFHQPVSSEGCGCNSGGAAMGYPSGYGSMPGYPAGSYVPLIGNPNPLPGTGSPTIIPSRDLPMPNPMPGKTGGN